MRERPDRAVANDLIGLYDATRKRAEALLAEYTFKATDLNHDPLHDDHRANIRRLVVLCDSAADALVSDYGG